MGSSHRQSREEHGGDDRRHRIPIQESKQKHSDPKQAAFSGLGNVLKGLWSNDLELYFERFLRRVVREEVERKIQDYLCTRATANQAGISRVTPFQLRFMSKLADTIFTHTDIIAEDNTPIQIALFDVRSQTIVNVGPLSCIKIEICALNGEFSFNDNEDWTEDEFNANILRERDGKRPLLNGDRFIALKNGVGCINKLMFTDNSRWIRSRKFRLGAKVVQPISNEASIKEGRSEPFVVKDYRGESYKKHYPPSLNDDVWRLEQIAKDGKIHKRLSFHGIHTVQDLLRLYTTNQSSLYEKVGNIPKRSWLAIIEHAKTCVIDDDKPYVYRTAEQPVGLLFNSIYVLVGVTFDGQNYCSPDILNPNERPLTSLGEGQSNATHQGLQQFNISTVNEGHQETWSGYDQPFTSTSYVDEEAHNYQTYADPLPDIREMPVNSSINGQFFSGLGTEGDSWPSHGSYLPVTLSGHSTEDDSSQIQFTNCCSPSTTWGQENDLYFASSEGADFCHSHFFNSTESISSSGKSKALWYKIRSALKCAILIGRDANARRNAKLLKYNY
ncbi:hypothetical protein SESBI_43318 [Sesbania bispinosa]|nr:hypothetical protein SESBI_43318 [Sesbania bispinosa]